MLTEPSPSNGHIRHKKYLLSAIPDSHIVENEDYFVLKKAFTRSTVGSNLEELSGPFSACGAFQTVTSYIGNSRPVISLIIGPPGWKGD
jgi:hypothetical protein